MLSEDSGEDFIRGEIIEAEPDKCVANYDCGQKTTHGLLDTSVGIVDQIGQRIEGGYGWTGCNLNWCSRAVWIQRIGKMEFDFVCSRIGTSPNGCGEFL